MRLSEILPQLTAKFPASDHRERDLPGGGTWFYIPWQLMRARLDEVCADHWSVSFSEPKFLDKYCYITCTLTICSIPRSAIGSVPIELISKAGRDMARGNAIERAHAEAFKCACEMFGICSYLDEQTDDRTKREFVRYMQSAGNGKVAVEYQRQTGQLPQQTAKPKPNQSKPFGGEPYKPDPNTVRLISDAQRKRLFTIGKQTGYSEDGLRRLIAAHGFTSTKDVTIAIYDTLCQKANDPEYKDLYNGMPATASAGVDNEF